MAENLEYYVDWKAQGYKIIHVSYPAYPYNKAATASMSASKTSGLKLDGLDLSESDIDITIEEVLLSDFDSEIDSLSALKNKRAFAETILKQKEEYQREKKSLIQSEEVKSNGMESYRTILEVTNNFGKAYFISQYFWVDDRLFEMKGSAEKLEPNLKRFEKLAATFKLL